jgi:hypothetical protein
MIDPHSNLILRWLKTLTDEQRAVLAGRYRSRLAKRHAASGNLRRDENPARLLAQLLLKDCAESLGLAPTELQGLLVSPQRHVMLSITWLALEQIHSRKGSCISHSTNTFSAVDDGEPDELPARIIRRMNDMPF